MSDAPAIVVENLRINLRGSEIDIVDDVSFAIAPGEVLGLVGESGSGKTTAGLALLGHARRGVEIVAGSVRVGDIDVLTLDHNQRRRLRGRVVSYVPQDPAASLNPALRIGTQLRETLEVHGFGENDSDRTNRLAEMMREVLLPDDPDYLRRYPHELSGGQQQRVGLAMAFACRPRVIVLDEPTTGLDVTTQAHVLNTVRELTELHRAAALYVSHDLAVVATLAARVAVMYAGRVVELGPTGEMFAAAAHPYTRRLIGAIPHISGRRQLASIPGRAPSPGQRPKGCFFAPRCTWREDRCELELPPLRLVSEAHSARCVRAEEVREYPGLPSGDTLPASEVPTETAVLSLRGVGAGYGGLQVVHDITLSLAPHECLAVVGESGSGKTTLARSIAGLHRERQGEIELLGEPLAASSRGRPREARRMIQYIFQNPYGSLNPRRTIGQIVRQPVDLFGTAQGFDVDKRVGEMLERVSLSASYAERYPDQLSGGERQRVAIARALICEPAVLVCDEITSALDVSVQAAIVDLLAELQRDLGLSMLFVTHNLPLVRSIAQRVAVMNRGRIVELGTVDSVLLEPGDDYTKALLADTPSLGAATT
ncbi:MAG: peptide/nickel transport system ATP-binding protein ddpF [Gaiellales bacterium]|nr:peptide/nickel transport system ATP-binding protein ddpF [Gaiellales bacterium]